MNYLKKCLLVAVILQACVLLAYDCDAEMSAYVDLQTQKHQINCCSNYEVQEAVVLYNRGVFGFIINFDRTGSKQLLMDALESAVLPLPYYTAANYYLGRLYLKEKNYTEAIWPFKNVLNDPDLPMQVKTKVNGFLGSSHFNLGHCADAIPFLETAKDNALSDKDKDYVNSILEKARSCA